MKILGILILVSIMTTSFSIVSWADFKPQGLPELPLDGPEIDTVTGHGDTPCKNVNNPGQPGCDSVDLSRCYAIAYEDARLACGTLYVIVEAERKTSETENHIWCEIDAICPANDEAQGPLGPLDYSTSDF